MADQLQIPSLAGQYDLFLTACGRLATDDPQVLARLSDLSKPLVAKEGDGDQGIFIRMFTGAAGGPKHLHMDLNTIRYFVNQPKANSTTGEITAFVEQFVGQKIRVKIGGGFRTPLDALPEKGIVRASMIKVKAGDVSISQTAATFTFDGGPLLELSWELSEEGKSVDTTLRLSTLTEVDSGYLVRLQEKASQVFQTMVLGEAAVTSGATS